ncbi:hypothetical protein AB0K34_33960 [Actinomadura sp. NPDC049382]|uniref:hypothetical protein n=1 Tax=Actinomadura sp. NPDC049382 TaxID=3158220 RepID=UPI0034477B0E
MRKTIRKALIATAVGATAVALTAAPASADPITIQNGGYVAGTDLGSFFTVDNGFMEGCRSLAATGHTPTVDGPLLGSLFTFDDVTFSWDGQVEDWCLLNGSVPIQVTALGLPWTFDLTGGHTGSGPGATMEGRLNNVRIRLYASSLACDATVGGPGAGGSDGYVEGTYTNPSTLTGNDGTLSMPYGAVNNLRVTSVTPGCTGLFAVGQTVALAGYIQVNRTSPVPPAAGISPTVNF